MVTYHFYKTFQHIHKCDYTSSSHAHEGYMRRSSKTRLVLHVYVYMRVCVCVFVCKRVCVCVCVVFRV